MNLLYRCISKGFCERVPGEQKDCFHLKERVSGNIWDQRITVFSTGFWHLKQTAQKEPAKRYFRLFRDAILSRNSENIRTISGDTSWTIRRTIFRTIKMAKIFDACSRLPNSGHCDHWPYSAPRTHSSVTFIYLLVHKSRIKKERKIRKIIY